MTHVMINLTSGDPNMYFDWGLLEDRPYNVYINYQSSRVDFGGQKWSSLVILCDIFDGVLNNNFNLTTPTIATTFNNVSTLVIPCTSERPSDIAQQSTVRYSKNPPITITKRPLKSNFSIRYTNLWNTSTLLAYNDVPPGCLSFNFIPI